MYNEDARMKVALFRYSVIGSLVSKERNRTQYAYLRDLILEQTYEFPDGSRRKVPARTLRHWVRQYRKHGFKGLFDSYRSDRGTCKAIDGDVLKRAEELRRELPNRSIQTIIELLKSDSAALTLPSERTLSRYMKRIGATKKRLKKGAGSYQRWEQEHANDLWHADTSHGVWLRDANDPSKAVKTKLILFVDDASRICTHGEFYFDEQLPRLVDCFSKALLQRGRPAQLLFDNAWIFHSTTISAMCAELGIQISFCRPRAPQGKGKVERLIKTIQDSFMTEASKAGVESLPELNALFNGWLNRYHKGEHSELGTSPLQRWGQDVNRIYAVTENELRRALLLRAKRKVHGNTATISLEGRDYQASVDLAGREVEVRWNPNQPETIDVWMFGEFVEVAPLFVLKPYSERKSDESEADAPGTPLSSSKKLASNWVGDQSEPYKSEELLSLTELLAMAEVRLARSLVDAEQSALRAFFHRVSPVRIKEIQTALDRAVLAKGSDLHVRFYVEQMELALRGR